jgi:hypothetical protein
MALGSACFASRVVDHDARHADDPGIEVSNDPEQDPVPGIALVAVHPVIVGGDPFLREDSPGSDRAPDRKRLLRVVRYRERLPARVEEVQRMVGPEAVDEQSADALGAGEVQAGRSCAIIFFDDANPQDAVIVAVYT